jgi:hypothetical protein
LRFAEVFGLLFRDEIMEAAQHAVQFAAARCDLE